MFLDLFCPLVSVPTAKKGQALILRHFSTRCWYSMENDQYSWYRSFPFFSGFQLHHFPQVSFGTLNWPSVSEYVDELIDALVEKKAPFVR